MKIKIFISILLLNCALNAVKFIDYDQYQNSKLKDKSIIELYDEFMKDKNDENASAIILKQVFDEEILDNVNKEEFFQSENCKVKIITNWYGFKKEIKFKENTYKYDYYPKIAVTQIPNDNSTWKAEIYSLQKPGAEKARIYQIEFIEEIIDLVISYAPAEPKTGEEISFSFKPDDKVYQSKEWKFTNKKSNDNNKATHTYSSPGDKIVSLTVEYNNKTYQAKETISIAPTEEIIPYCTPGYGYVEVTWDLSNIGQNQELRLKIEGRNRAEQPENKNITGNSKYILDRNFMKDSDKNFQPVTIWVELVNVSQDPEGSSCEISSKMEKVTPKAYPVPQTANYENKKIRCELIIPQDSELKDSELKDRFIGFSVDGNDEIIQQYYSNNNLYEFSYNGSPPQKIAARYKSKDKVEQENQSSNTVDVISMENQAKGSNEETNSTDKFDLKAEFYYGNRKRKYNGITLTWNKIANATNYTLFRSPVKEYDNLVYASTHLDKANFHIKNEQILYNNNFHNTEEKEKLKSKHIYTYMVKADLPKVNYSENIVRSQNISLYYYNESHKFIKIVQKGTCETPNENIVINNKSIDESISNLSYTKMIINTPYLNNSFDYYFFEIEPYSIFNTNADRYIYIASIFQHLFEGTEQVKDKNSFLALLAVVNEGIVTRTQIEKNSIIKVPVPKALIHKF